MIWIALHDTVCHLQQQFNNVQPEAPPGSNSILKLLRWLMWGVMIAGIGGIIYAGGKFAWERWNGGVLESPKMVVGALIGGVLATSAGSIMNSIVFQQ